MACQVERAEEQDSRDAGTDRRLRHRHVDCVEDDEQRRHDEAVRAKQDHEGEQTAHAEDRHREQPRRTPSGPATAAPRRPAARWSSPSLSRFGGPGASRSRHGRLRPRFVQRLDAGSERGGGEGVRRRRAHEEQEQHEADQLGRGEARSGQQRQPSSTSAMPVVSASDAAWMRVKRSGMRRKPKAPIRKKPAPARTRRPPTIWTASPPHSMAIMTHSRRLWPRAHQSGRTSARRRCPHN